MTDRVLVWDRFVRVFHWSLVTCVVVNFFVIDDGESRYLYFNVRLMQSQMSLKAPHDLALRYTQKMMGFLLFHPAGNLVQQRLGQIWLDQAHFSAYAESNTDISANLPNGKRTTVRGGADCFNDLNCFIVTVTWQQPGSGGTHSVMAIGRITGGE